MDSIQTESVDSMILHLAILCLGTGLYYNLTRIIIFRVGASLEALSWKVLWKCNEKHYSG
jgi:hypothetical protein